MSWFWAAVEWRIGWMVAEAYVALVAMVVIGLIAVVFVDIPILLKQMRCRHERYRETMSCEARCLDCGKDLGFIETQRQRNPGGEK